MVLATDSYRPRYGGGQGPPPPPGAQAAMYHFRGNQDNQPRNDASSRPTRREFTYRPPKAHERPLLTSRRQLSPDQVTFRSEDVQDKFRDVDELTESDESEMEISDSGGDDHRPSKRPRITTTGRDDPTVAKWSNPDPYTALPLTDESLRKNKDVVKLIRKARNAPTSSRTTADTATYDDDFISFDFGDEQWEDETLPPRDAPSGPRLDRRPNGNANVGSTEVETQRYTNGSSMLHKRKRREYEMPADPVLQRDFYSDAMIRREWRAEQDSDSSPWLKQTAHPVDYAGIALHNEIIDFYDWVRPRDYEANIRADLVSRLNNAFNRLEPGELRSFGSYAAGLYLPTGDMDLVYLLRNFNPNRRTPFPAKLPHAHFRRYSTFLTTQEIAKPGSILIIGQAKVQIIKFVDRISGLKVDLCFNNDSGLTANDTFQSWKTRYPAMPIVVSIIKQFLMIRGLNDVSTGGLGGFSTICLATSLIQHMPFSGQPPNLGKLLLEFFNLYGNLINRDQVAIRLDPPGYVDKASYGAYLLTRDKPNRLTIIDPNRPENNISGGTNQIDMICECFSQAHERLSSLLSDYTTDRSRVQSFLASIVGGDFSAYETQRRILRELHYGPDGEPGLSDIPPPPLSVAPKHKRPPPPPPASTGSIDIAPSETSLQRSAATQRSAQKRAARLLRSRPDLAIRIPAALSVKQAVALGGYADGAAMAEDLNRREQAQK